MDGFIAAVVKPGIGPIAAYPVVLKLLLQAARRGRVRTTRMEAYHLGTQGLAAGADAVSAALDVPLPQRLTGARRLAVATVLSDAREVWQRRLPGAEFHTLSLEDVSTASVTYTALDAVYASGLLQGGADRRRWAHRSIEEFLCATGLQSLPRHSVKRLVLHPRATHRLKLTLPTNG
ncbi:hypothetical protein [Actinoplanes auranticolor]|uniref:Uncharacterized protein n=1 Tax=Actinoplanes auranticolor TaxID=47988 RepID=A0A919VQI6_9ACTN|nr:hypothetical protein [Actinoplanes auranticolor]GIM74964.1 hypothetical protein Aau02nite_63630 [Actinoplanes auranticolor]